MGIFSIVVFFLSGVAPSLGLKATLTTITEAVVEPFDGTVAGREDRERRKLAVSCGLGSGGNIANGALSSGTGTRLVVAGGGVPTFDARGQVWGRLELFVGGEWVTVYGRTSSSFEDEEAEVGCRQLGNELGYTPISWSVVNSGYTPDGSGKQYNVESCQGSEEELSSCGTFNEKTDVTHEYDIGLQCAFVVAGDECEECPAGKYRLVSVCVCV